MKWFLVLFLICTSLQAMDLTICPQSPVITFDPAKMYDATSNSLKNIIFEGLYESNDVGQIVPILASKAEFSKDKKQLTVELKKNVAFHSNASFKPSRTMNADDVIFTFKRQMPNYNKNKDQSQFWGWKSASSFTKKIIDIKKVNDYAVTFVFDEPSENFLSFLTRHTALILSQEYFQKFPKIFESNPIGTGPLMAASLENKNDFTLIKNPLYHGTSKIKSLHYLILNGNDEIQAAIKKADCDLLDSPPLYFIKEAVQSGKYKRISGIENSLSYIAFNTSKQPLSLPEVRKALTLALDLNKYLHEIYLDYAKVASTPVAPPFPEFLPTILPQNFDVLASKDILKRYGLQKGFNITLWTFDSPRAYLPEPYKLARMIKNDLEKINVHAKIVLQSVEELQRRAQYGEHDLLLTGWANMENTKDAYSDLPCANGDRGVNDAKWCHQIFTKTYYEFSQEKDPKKKLELARNMSLIFKQEMPWAPLFYSGKNFLLKSTLPNDLLIWNEFHNHLRKVIND